MHRKQQTNEYKYISQLNENTIFIFSHFKTRNKQKRGKGRKQGANFRNFYIKQQQKRSFITQQLRTNPKTKNKTGFTMITSHSHIKKYVNKHCLLRIGIMSITLLRNLRKVRRRQERISNLRLHTNSLRQSVRHRGSRRLRSKCRMRGSRITTNA